MNKINEKAVSIFIKDRELRKKLLKVLLDYRSFLRERYFISEFSNYVRKNYPQVFKEEEFRQININSFIDYIANYYRGELK